MERVNSHQLQHSTSRTLLLRAKKCVRLKSTLFAMFATCFLLSACDRASVQLCGEYACLFVQSDQQNRCRFNPQLIGCNSTTRIRQCEAAGNIRDRAPQILTLLRENNRSCSAGISASNNIPAGTSLNLSGRNDQELLWDDDLAQVSARHARDMANNRFESFIGSNGLSTLDRTSLAGISSTLISESINTGPQTSAEAINAWLDIGTDCRQMLNPQFTRIGLACALPTNADSGPYWSLLLARPSR